ncbi:MAG: hypothetical protein FWD32_00225 [Firmicutes bacterium]|nr:hypothetical protein [Bacillota bacterium]
MTKYKIGNKVRTNKQYEKEYPEECKRSFRGTPYGNEQWHKSGFYGVVVEIIDDMVGVQIPDNFAWGRARRVRFVNKEYIEFDNWEDEIKRETYARHKSMTREEIEKENAELERQGFEELDKMGLKFREPNENK